MSKSNDRALRFYNEVLGLSRLHYGMWLPDDEISFDNLRKAQIRYENFLIDSIPDGVKTILDVGCGTGILSKNLLDHNYQVEGLSPDDNQKEIFTKTIGAPFHHCVYQDFSATDKFDCVIMSESCQYIDIDSIFKNTQQALKKDGYLMICDYFKLDNASGELGKSGHNYNAFMEKLNNSNFTVITNKDITGDVLKNLDLGKDLVNKMLIGLDIGTEKIRSRYRRLSKFILWLFRNKIKKATNNIDLLDTEKFKKTKTYRFILLQVNS